MKPSFSARIATAVVQTSGRKGCAATGSVVSMRSPSLCVRMPAVKRIQMKTVGLLLHGELKSPQTLHQYDFVIANSYHDPH